MQSSSSTGLQNPRIKEAGEPARPRELPEGSFGVFLLLFFLSGMCALIYEIVWTRRLTLIFGVTVYSISTVLVAFMGGLACGSIWFGNFIDKRKDPIRIYALLEVGIGVSAILIPFALDALTPAYRLLYNKTGASNYVMSLVKFLMSAGVLIVPTTLMGATLPVLSKFVVRRVDQRGSSIGSLYAINTLGAMAGCFLAGFVLLGWIGISRSEYVAVSVNLLVGAIAFGLHRRLGNVFPAETDTSAAKIEEGEKRYSRGTLKVVLLIFGLSGMAALAYEVLWSRILVFLLGSSIYSFSFILAVYLLGLTAGSLLFARVVDKLKRPLHAFAWLEMLIGLSVLAGLVLFRRLPFTPYSLNANAWDYLAKNLISTVIVVLPPTLLMGATFPTAVRIYARSLGAIGRQTGVVYAVNTVGAIIGSFVAGFVLIALVGSKNSVLLLVLVSMTCGLVLLSLSMKEEKVAALNWVAAAFFALPVAGLPFGNNLMEELSVKLLEGRTNEEWKVIAFDEDATAAVAVAENADGTRVLTVNGISMTYRHVEPQLMAHLPIALADNPRDVLVVCFGMGTTFVSARAVGMDVDFVELCPYVVEAFEYFQDDPSLLTEPGVGEIIADGRNYLLLSNNTYDVITIDPPPPPYSAGTVNLYTKEFYELCKRRMTPEGVICQWIPMYSSTEKQFKMLLRTFSEVFPHTSVWTSGYKMGTFLIGTPEPLRFEREAFDKYFDAPAVREDLSLYIEDGTDRRRTLPRVLLDENGVRRYVRGAPVMSDDLPLIEFPLFRTDPQSELMRTSLIGTTY